MRKPSAEKTTAGSLVAKAQVQYLAFSLLVERRPSDNQRAELTVD
jgi:hypothetical protein